MTAVVLALVSAACYGMSDFVGGLASRRAGGASSGSGAWSVAVTAQLACALTTALVAPLLPGDPRPVDWLWALLAALGGGFGTAFLYRGLAAGRMGVVAPVSGVSAAVLPVAVGLGLGERPGPVVWVGIAAALPAIWLVSSAPATSEPEAAASGSERGGLLDGLLAGLGFGVLFAALGQVPDGSGMWPLAVTAAASGLVIVALAVVLRAPWVPRTTASYWGALAGPLAAAAAVTFVLAVQRGYLTVSSVLAALYPAATVLLAATVLREPIHRAQAFGLVLCGLAVALVASG